MISLNHTDGDGVVIHTKIKDLRSVSLTNWCQLHESGFFGVFFDKFNLISF